MADQEFAIPSGESPGGNTIVVDVPPTSATTISAISLRLPTKHYADVPSPSSFVEPPLEWLQGTWSVTHSTLPMWTKAKNVRITYTILPSASGTAQLGDIVTSEPTQRSLLPQPRSIRGVDTADGPGAWNWRGRGWLRIASSHWEVLGWGERGGERWVVTWFAASMFTPAGVDIYSSEKGGIGESLYKDIMQALEALEVKELVDLVKKDMKEVKIEY